MLLLCFCPLTQHQGRRNKREKSPRFKETVASKRPNSAASSHLHCDQAGQLEMPLHHGEAAQEVSTLGAKVWEFPGQDREPARHGDQQKAVTLAQKKSGPPSEGDSPPSPFRQRLVSPAASQVGGFQRRQVNRFVVTIHHQLPIWSERGTALVAARLFAVLDFLSFSQQTPRSGSPTRPTYPESSRTQ